MNKLSLLAVLLVTCFFSLNGGAATPSSAQTPVKSDKIVIKPLYGAPQVVYRIDKERYISLEDYTNCDNGSLYYHNKAKGIKTRLWIRSRGTMNYRGKFIWAAKSDNMLAIPLVSGDNDPCGDRLRGCARSVLSASHDGGDKFSNIIFHATNSSDSKDYEIVITDDAIYIKDNRYSADQNTDKYAINKEGVFFQPRETLINDTFYKKMLEMGIPEDALDKDNPLGVRGSLLSTKYSYTAEQLSVLGGKVSKLYYYLRDNTPAEKIPNLIPFPLSSTQFRCNVDLLPRQPKSQG